MDKNAIPCNIHNVNWFKGDKNPIVIAVGTEIIWESSTNMYDY